jgi:hypothetical protein
MNSRAVCFMAVALVVGCGGTRADSCSDIKLPQQVQQRLSTAYAGWQIVTPALLDEYDRRLWSARFGNACPGLIKGKFTDEEEGYVVNLVRKAGAVILQQLIYFRPTNGGFDIMTIDPSCVVASVSVIRKGPPGKYRSADTEKSVTVTRETIRSIAMEAGELVYYWDGTRFRSIATSM